MTIQTLREIQKGDVVCITAVTAPGELGQRLRDMGLVPGTKVEVLGRAPLGDPMSIRLLAFTLSLRQSEAEHVLVTADANFTAPSCCSSANQACIYRNPCPCQKS